MKTFVTFALLASLLACGSEYVEPSTQPSPPPTVVVSRNEPVDAGVDSAPDVVIVADAGSDVVTPDSSEPDAGSTQCEPTIGHCVTHMATLCYERSFDDTAACDVSGQTSGWSTGPCVTGTRSSGGCVRGCDVSYSYPLGGGDATEATRQAVKEECEGSGGTYIDTRSYESDSGTY